MYGIQEEKLGSLIDEIQDATKEEKQRIGEKEKQDKKAKKDKSMKKKVKNKKETMHLGWRSHWPEMGKFQPQYAHGNEEEKDETGQQIDTVERQEKDTYRGNPGCNFSRTGDGMMKAWKKEQILLDSRLDKGTSIVVSDDDYEEEEGEDAA